MKKYIFILFVAVTGAWTSLFADPAGNLADVKNHLQSAGYTITEGNDSFTARRQGKLTLQVKSYEGGFLFQSFFKKKANLDESGNGLMDLVNQLNQKSTAARFYLDKDGDLAIEGFFPGEYNKQAFSVFLENFNSDFLKTPGLIQQLGKYLD